MTTFDILIDFLTEILLQDRDLSVRLLWVRVVLQLGQHLREEREGAVFGVGNQEGQIDEVVRIGEVAEMSEKHG